MKKVCFILLSVIIIFNVVGCVTSEPQLTSLQLRVMESKELEGTLDDAFKSSVAILQDKGYDIKNSDYQGGIISGIASNQLRLHPGWTQVDTTTINLERFTENRVKLRLSISRQIYNYLGWKMPYCLVEANALEIGTKFVYSGTVEDPKVYQDFYAEVQKEMFRRAQLNK